MLNPIDTDRVIRDGGAAGAFPGQLHEGVAWWLASCLVVTQRAVQIVVAHDGHPVIAGFTERFCQGAINAEHHACTVRALGVQPREQVPSAIETLGAGAGAWLSGENADGVTTVRIALFDRRGVLLSDSTGLHKIRRMIAEDRVPRPVNAGAKGRIVAESP
ncbi:hypothetical protein [Streptomyces sp. JW3]|uniref:hypothetical protein n=1 Tax=Streptomyces sp. JW3 TaxID=3456955 RepID=UPI003FA47F44